MSKELVLCFLDINSPQLEDCWLNRVAARLAPSTQNGQQPKIHVELLFRDSNTDTEGLASSIYYNKRVHLTRKRFSRVNWQFRKIYCSESAYTKVKNYCTTAKDCKFNKLGYFAFFMGIRLSGRYPCYFGWPPRYFCSELVCSALKAGGILPADTHTVVHPEKLYQLLAPSTSLTTIRRWDQSKLTY